MNAPKCQNPLETFNPCALLNQQIPRNLCLFLSTLYVARSLEAIPLNIGSGAAETIQIDPMVPRAILRSRLNLIHLHPFLLTSCMAETIGTVCCNEICH